MTGTKHARRPALWLAAAALLTVVTIVVWRVLDDMAAEAENMRRMASYPESWRGSCACQAK